MTQPAQPGLDPYGQPLAQVSAQPQGIADRIDMLNQSGHDWMPADMQTTLASSQTSDSQLKSIADSIKQQLSNTWSGFSEALDDPVLHKQPSGALALARYLTAAIGPVPVAETDLHQIQQNLQKQGFGKDLPISGEWGSDWNAAYNDWINTLKARQVAGDKTGSMSTAKAAGHWYDIFNPVHDVNGIIGYAKAIPGDVRDLVATVVGSAVNTATDPQSFGFHESKAHQEASAGAGAARAVESFLGNPNAGKRVQQEIEHPWASTAQDAGTILTIAPLIRTGSAAALAAHGAWQSGVDAAAAQRSTGVIASSLFGGLRRQTLGMTAGSDVLDASQRSIMDAEMRDALRRGPLNSQVFQNIPLLRQVGPVVGRLADADGLYYRARTLLATPYQYGQVRALGQAGQTTLMTGAALQGGAQLEQAAGLSNPQTQAITNTQALNTVDLNINRIAHTPFAHPFSDAIDSLGYVLHGPLGSTAASDKVGDRVQAMVNAGSNMLGQVDVRGAWERAVTKASGQKTSIDDLQKAFGSPENLDRFMYMKLADLGAAHYAQHMAQLPVSEGGRGLALGTQEYRDAVGELADEVWKNPALHANAVKELAADPIELENRIAADMVHNAGDAKTYAANATAWMNAGSELTDIIRTGLAKHLFGADGRTLIANAQDNFDFGLGQDSPVRLMSTTRRDYVNQVQSTLSRVQQMVNDARTQAGRAVADLESRLGKPQAEERYAGATSTEGPQVPGETAVRLDENGKPVRKPTVAQELQQARLRQAALERALENNDMKGFAATAKKIIQPTTRTRGTWDRLNKDTALLRQLVDQGSAPGQRLTLRHLIDQGVNPDELYTNINGEPRIPSEDIGSGDWMRQHLQTDNGAVGLGHTDTKSAQEAAADVARYRAALDAATTDEQKTQIVEQMKNYGFNQFGLTEKTLGVKTPDGLADLLDEQARKLASEVFLTHDAPPELKAALQRIKDLGYRPMVGSHIGHSWDGSLPSMPELGQAITTRRKIAGVIGVTPDQISPRAAGQDARIRVMREVGKVPEQGGKFPARHTPDSIMSVMTDKNLFTPDMKPLEQVAYAGAKAVGLHDKGIAQLAKERGITDPLEAEKQYRGEIARGLQVRDVPRKEFVRVMTTPGEFENGSHWDGVNQKTANLLYLAVKRGYGDRPGYVVGLSHLEDWFRGGFGLGNAAVKYADSEFLQRAANLPNDLVIARNRLRFTLSPFFDWRRIAKQNYKMSADGVDPVFNPLAHMIDNGTVSKAHDYLNRLVGEPPITGFDDADRYLHQQSVWGMYNSRHFEAYYAWEKKLQGETDDEIRAGIHRVFDYGSARAGGARSPLERSVNTVFFPFSFEKTLIRNTGAYMINHPQQALLMTGAMTAYNEANQNDQIHQWVQDHLPILRDLQKLNGFAHGISPGQLGGINAPLFNLFMPQVWGKQMTVANLKKNLPIWNDFGQMFSDVRAQAVIGKNALLNTTDYATHLGAPRGQLDPYRPTVTPQAQTRMAERKRNQFITALQPVLDYNAQQPDDTTKATFPNDPRLPADIRGQVVNRSSIGSLVKVWYPAYNPAAAQTYAVQQADKAQQYIANLPTATAKQQTAKRDYTAFVKLANTLQGHLQRGDYDTTDGAAIMGQFRLAAVAAAETDPSFLKFYNDHYRFLLGPIEEIRG